MANAKKGPRLKPKDERGMFKSTKRRAHAVVDGKRVPLKNLEFEVDVAGTIRAYAQSVSTTTTHPNGDPASSGTAYGDELLRFHGRDAYDVVSKLRSAADVLSPHTHARPEEIEAEVFVLIRRVRPRASSKP